MQASPAVHADPTNLNTSKSKNTIKAKRKFPRTLSCCLTRHNDLTNTTNTRVPTPVNNSQRRSAIHCSSMGFSLHVHTLIHPKKRLQTVRAQVISPTPAFPPNIILPAPRSCFPPKSGFPPKLLFRTHTQAATRKVSAHHRTGKDKVSILKQWSYTHSS